MEDLDLSSCFVGALRCRFRMDKTCSHQGGFVPVYEVSSGTTLLGNWVEERQVAHIDQKPRTIKDLHVQGHKGALSLSSDTKMEGVTTNSDSYQKPEVSPSERVGKRRQLLEKELYSKFSAEMHKDLNCSPPPIDYTSTTREHYHRDFTPIHEPATTQFGRPTDIPFGQGERPFLPEHDINSEQPVTFWSTNLSSVHGVTQINSKNFPFKKNAAFSTPIDEYKDDPKPGEAWNF